MTPTLQRELIELLAGVVNVDPTTVSPDAALDEAGITSLDLVEAIFAIEEKYGISVNYNANTVRFETVGGLIDAVAAQIEAQRAQQREAQLGAAVPVAGA